MSDLLWHKTSVAGKPTCGTAWEVPGCSRTPWDTRGMFDMGLACKIPAVWKRGCHDVPTIQSNRSVIFLPVASSSWMRDSIWERPLIPPPSRKRSRLPPSRPPSIELSLRTIYRIKWRIVLSNFVNVYCVIMLLPFLPFTKVSVLLLWKQCTRNSTCPLIHIFSQSLVEILSAFSQRVLCLLDCKW